MAGPEGQTYLITLMKKSTAQEIRTMNWNGLLGYVKNRYPEAYIAPLDEIAFFQIGHQENVFRFDGIIDDGNLEKSCFFEPFFTKDETQKQFASLNLCYGTKGLMDEIIGQFVRRQESYCNRKRDMYQQALERQKIMQMKHRKYYLVRAFQNMEYVDFNDGLNESRIVRCSGSWLHVIDLVKLYKQIDWSDNIFVYSRW